MSIPVQTPPRSVRPWRAPGVSPGLLCFHPNAFRLKSALACVTVLLSFASFAAGQPPRPERGNRGQTSTAASFIERLLTLDANGDGKLSRSEVTDGRLQSLFERTDSNKDGILTQEEMTAFFDRESATLNAGRQAGRSGGPGRFGPPPGGPGPMGRPPRGRPGGPPPPQP
jgi:EF hand domain-containing protein